MYLATNIMNPLFILVQIIHYQRTAALCISHLTNQHLHILPIEMTKINQHGQHSSIHILKILNYKNVYCEISYAYRIIYKTHLQLIE